AHSDVGVLMQQPTPTDGSTYRSKKESFIKFVKYGTCGQGPCYWIATDRHGTQYFYGSESTSQLLVPGGSDVRVWALSRVQDLFGNYWTVTYNQIVATGELTPNVITYTLGPNLSTYRTVEFFYDSTRTDTEEGFYSSRGYPQSMTKLLTEIQIKS